MTRQWMAVTGVLLALGFGLPDAFARDLQGRLGLGFNNEWVSSSVVSPAPAISVKYSFTRDLAVAANFGVTTTSPSSSAVGTKFFKNIFLETNLNFYFLVGAGLVSANSLAGVQFLSGFGAEFFIPGLESLGFSFETGASVDNLNTTGTFILRTLGAGFLNAGIHFYF